MITVKSLQKSDSDSLAEKQQQKILARVKYVRIIIYKIVCNVSNVVKKYIKENIVFLGGRPREVELGPKPTLPIISQDASQSKPHTIY